MHAPGGRRAFMCCRQAHARPNCALAHSSSQQDAHGNALRLCVMFVLLGCDTPDVADGLHSCLLGARVPGGPPQGSAALVPTPEGVGGTAATRPTAAALATAAESSSSG